MALRNIFKNQVKEEKPVLPAKPPEDESGVSPDETKPSKSERRFIGLLVSPHLTEKALNASKENWYTFRVAKLANRIAIRKAVEERYGVKVEAVRIITQHPKKIRLGRIQGTVPGFKKAMVKLKAGQTLSLH